MKTWYFFRHSLATYSKDGYGSEILTAKILPQETAPIYAMGNFLKTTPQSLNFSSEIIRCRQTAAIITDVCGKQFATDKRLNEYYDETYDVFTKRVHSWLNQIEQVTDSAIVVCTHGAVIAALKHLILCGVMHEKNQYDFPQCGELWIIANKSLSKIDFNKPSIA